MSSSTDHKTCGICFVPMQGQALFTSECSHSFHLTCISNYISVGNRACPICYSLWKQHLPFVAPLPHPPPQYFPSPTPMHRQSLFHSPAYEPEPICFDDDEPLSYADDNAMLIDSESEGVTLRAVPERLALASSESSSLFSVLVGLKAPSLSDHARSLQRAPVDIVTVLDVSGSMAGKKLDLVKRAVEFVIDNLGVSDRLSIVCFSDRANRWLPLRKMSDVGRVKAKRAVASLCANGGTNIVDGLTKGTQVLDERRYKNPVCSIIFLSDGNDNYSMKSVYGKGKCVDVGEFMRLLPPSISPRDGVEGVETIPVHSFGFGSDHDPIIMHGISDASGGTFSFIESIEMVQDAFASCIGGLLSVVTQELRLKLRSASNGVEIKSIPSGRYKSEITNHGSEGGVNVGDLYADEEREFLINLSVPICLKNETKTSLLDITCTYRDAVSKQKVLIEGDLVEIRRPISPSPEDLATNLEVDRQRNRLRAAESIQQAQQMAEAGNLSGAKDLLAKKRVDLMGTASAQAGDGMMKWLEGEMKETEFRMGSMNMYQQSGRAFALSGMSSHASQRAATRGSTVFSGGSTPFGGPFGGSGVGGGGDMAVFGAAAPVGMGYATPQMANMVAKSQQLRKGEEENKTAMKE